MNAATEEGAAPCYVAVDEARQLVYGANYHKGALNTYKIQPDGSLEAAASLFHKEPTGPHKNQDKAHTHYTDLTPDQRLAVCDLGTDRVYTYDVTEAGEVEEVAVYVAEPGTGPRHLVFHPNKAIAYLLVNWTAVLVSCPTMKLTAALLKNKKFPPYHKILMVKMVEQLFVFLMMDGSYTHQIVVTTLLQPSQSQRMA